MFRVISGGVGLLALTACNQGDLVFSGSEPTTPTADFNISAPDVDTDRPVDDCAITDGDGDGYGPDCERGDDCNDEDPEINPGQVEVPYNAIDDDCNDDTRDDDLDDDGFPLETDCDDNNNAVNPGKPEICNDGVDNDCEPTTADVGEFGELTCPWPYTNRDHCNAVLTADAAKAGVDGYYQLRNGAAWCDMTTEAGGWTLVLVAADDESDSFTFAAGAILAADAAQVGALGSFEADFKSWAYNVARFRDLMFSHAPSDTFAVYEDVSDNSKNLGAFVAGVSLIADPPVCFDPASTPYPTAGYAMSAGNLVAGAGPDGRALCSTDLYFNVGDHDTGALATCSVPTDAADADRAWGPVWNTSSDCTAGPFEDAAWGGIGPNGAAGREAAEEAALGWGHALGMNTSDVAGGNRLYVYVR